MDCWEVPHTAQLRAVLDWCLRTQKVDRLLVVHRKFLGAREKELSYPEALDRSRRLFGGRILRESWCRRWPGTISTKSTALVLVIDFDASLIDVMAQAGPTLGDWLERPPNSLPEDLCLYSEAAELPALVSVTHERDAWLLSGQQPTIENIRPSALRTSELMIPTERSDFIA